MLYISNKSIKKDSIYKSKITFYLCEKFSQIQSKFFKRSQIDPYKQVIKTISLK